MVVKVNLSKDDIEEIYKLACSTSDPVYIHSLDDKVRIDAKSTVGLMWLRFDTPVKIVCENERVCEIAKKRWGYID